MNYYMDKFDYDDFLEFLGESFKKEDFELDYVSGVLGARSKSLAMDKRSEERRVGKECRSRWSPYH